MDKKYILLSILMASILTGKAQKYMGEENIIYYSDIVAPAAVDVADLDNDGDPDVLLALEKEIIWYENTDSAGNYSTGDTLLSLTDAAGCIFAADLDGDGDEDILAAIINEDRIVWFENTGGAGNFSTEQVITEQIDRAWSVYAADLDGDGDLDVLSTSVFDDKVAWYENTDGQGTFGPQQIILQPASWARSIRTADLDGEGDQDILFATGSYAENTISWLDNTDGQGTFDSLQVVSTMIEGASFVNTADIDGDGDNDVLSSSVFDDKIAWYENTDGQGTFGPQQVITTLANGATYVNAADLDGDGDLDVLSASRNDNKIASYENTDGKGTFGPEQILSTTAEEAGFVHVSDLDGDGDPDVLSASCDFKIAWHRNTLPMRLLDSPEDTTIFPGKDASFRIIADSARDYQWQADTGSGFFNLGDNLVYSSTQTDTLRLTEAPFKMRGTLYRCLVSGKTGSLYSDVAELIVRDTISPEIITAPGKQFLVANEQCQAIVPDYTDSISVIDNSYEELDIVQEPQPWINTVSGMNSMVFITVYDADENYDDTVFYVDVTDQTSPVITSEHGDQVLEPNIYGEIYLPDFTGFVEATDNCSLEPYLEVTQSPPGFSIITDTVKQVDLIVTDEEGNSSQVSFNLSYNINYAPEITSQHNDQTLEADAGCQAILPDYTKTVTATDDHDWPSELVITQDPEPFTSLSDTLNNVTLTVTDTEGKSSGKTFNVKVLDKIKPTVSCLEDMTRRLDEGQTTYTVSGTEFNPVSVNDNCSVDSTVNNFNQMSTLDGAVFPVGLTTVTWTIMDGAGNVAECSFEVDIREYTGLNTWHKNGISVYPNPTEGTIYLESTQQELIMVKIHDITGQAVVVKANLDPRTRIDMSHLSDGIYFVSIKTGKQVYTLKIVKE